MVIQPTCRMRMVKRLSTGSVEFNTLHCKGPEAVAIRLSSLWIPLKTTCIAFELILSCHQLLLQRWLRFRVRYIKIISDDDQCKMYQTRHWIVILQHVCGMLGLFKMLKMDERGQIILPTIFQLNHDVSPYFMKLFRNSLFAAGHYTAGLQYSSSECQHQPNSL